MLARMSPCRYGSEGISGNSYSWSGYRVVQQVKCDDVSTPRKAIWIATQQRSVDLLDTVIHELLHAALPDLCEETILETATDLAKILTRLGAKLELPSPTNDPRPYLTQKTCRGGHGFAPCLPHRWPEWNPSDQEHRDFRRILKNMNYEDLDEAMLQVKVNYSSKIPQLKWIVTAYHRLRDERQKGQDSQSAQRADEAQAAELRQVESERQECMSRLQALSHQDLNRAIDLAESRHRKILGSFSSRDLLRMSWLSRFAVLFELDQVGDVRHPFPAD